VITIRTTFPDLRTKLNQLHITENTEIIDNTPNLKLEAGNWEKSEKTKILTPESRRNISPNINKVKPEVEIKEDLEELPEPTPLYEIIPPNYNIIPVKTETAPIKPTQNSHPLWAKIPLDLISIEKLNHSNIQKTDEEPMSNIPAEDQINMKIDPQFMENVTHQPQTNTQATTTFKSQRRHMLDTTRIKPSQRMRLLTRMLQRICKTDEEGVISTEGFSEDKVTSVWTQEDLKFMLTRLQENSFQNIIPVKNALPTQVGSTHENLFEQKNTTAINKLITQASNGKAVGATENNDTIDLDEITDWSIVDTA
jgi:hypothetical protein